MMSLALGFFALSGIVVWAAVIVIVIMIHLED
jgi:hypothetical protein